MPTQTKQSVAKKLHAAVTEDGKLLPFNTIAAKGLTALFAAVAVIFVAGVVLIWITSSPVLLALIGAGIIVFLYQRRYGAALPPAVADALERRAKRGGSAAPTAPTAERVSAPRADRSLKS